MTTRATWITFLILPACASTPSAPTDRPTPSDLRGLDAAHASVGSVARSGPPAYLADQPITWADLAPRLAEAAGAQVLDEVVLDRLLERELADRSLSITPDDLAAERDRFARSLQREGPADPAIDAGAVERLRRSRGLGPARYAALLARNAALRKLAGEGAPASPDELARDLDDRFGEKLIARILVVPNERDAAAIRASIAADPARLAAFTRAAVDRSIDASAPSGGLLRPFGLSEPSLPVALRQTLASLAPGELSPVVAVDGGYALALVEARIPPSPPPAGEESRADARVRERHQRAEMERLAAELLRRAPLSVVDESLAWSRSRR